MKARLLFLTLFFLGLAFSANAQQLGEVGQMPFSDKADFKKYEEQVLESAKYILWSQYKTLEKSETATNAQLLIFLWMQGTPDYTFVIDETIGKVTKKNPTLMGVYFASMVKYVLEHKEMASNEQEVRYNSIYVFLDYCANPSKKAKINGEIKKMIKAKNENRLREYLYML